MPARAILYEPSVDQVAWMGRASCRSHPNPDLWFSERPEDQAEAKRICRACPVRSECLFHQSRFSATDGNYGIWGGKDGVALGHERKRLRKAA